ncbi:sensor histidine kinase [Cohnella suwonensis]|uniref:histidine kinase n=1 Tax=Cohnella suwonensis TaxID=696072 RepID=A0ABW0M1S8_9BACL
MTYLLFVMIPVIAVGFFAYTITVQALQEKISASIRGTLEQIRDNILYKTDDINRISSRLYYDYTLQKYLRNYEEGWYTYETTKQYIIPTLENVLNYTNSNILLTLYLENDTFPEMYNLRGETIDPLSGFKNYDVFHQKRIENEAWWTGLSFDKKKNDGVIWKQVGLDQKFDNISLLRRMEDVQEWKAIGLIRVTVKLNELLDSVHYAKIGESSKLAVYDEDNMPIFVSGAVGQESKDGSDASEELLLTQSIPEMGWHIVASIPHSVFNEHAKKVRNLTILVCLASFLVLSFISIAVSRYFARRVGKIVATLRSFQEGEFHKRILFKGKDEFAQIASALNVMGQNTHDLIQQVYVTNLLKNEAELASLQAQINPHFLYNTLSSISRLAKFGEIDKLHQMVMGLAKFYRLSLNDGKTIISIEKEIEQMQAYIDIQKTKYGSRMTVNYDIDSAIYPYDTVKLILQPFIENILEHAWRGDQIQIDVAASLSKSRIEFSISDNGIGMNEETIAEIFTDKGVRRGYGIRNVDERIKLQYGKENGVRIHSGLGMGTKVLIAIPACQEQDKEKAR